LDINPFLLRFSKRQVVILPSQVNLLASLWSARGQGKNSSAGAFIQRTSSAEAEPQRT